MAHQILIRLHQIIIILESIQRTFSPPDKYAEPSSHRHHQQKAYVQGNLLHKLISFTGEYCCKPVIRSQASLSNSAAVILREVCLRCCYTPLVSFLNLAPSHPLRIWNNVVFASSLEPTNATLSSLTQCKAEILSSTFTPSIVLLKFFDCQNLISDSTVWSKVDVWILSGRWTHIVKLDLLKCSLT